VAIDDDGFSRLPVGDHFEEGFQWFGIILKTYENIPLAVGFAVADMVNPIDGVPTGHKVIHHVGVPSNVCTYPVHNE